MVVTTSGAAMKAKGSAFERDVAGYLRTHGHCYAERAYGAGRQDDRGDITGMPGWVIEVKNHRSIDLAGFTDEAEAERLNARAEFGAVVAKRRGRPVEDSYVVVNLRTFARMLAEDS